MTRTMSRQTTGAACGAQLLMLLLQMPVAKLAQAGRATAAAGRSTSCGDSSCRSNSSCRSSSSTQTGVQGVPVPLCVCLLIDVAVAAAASRPRVFLEKLHWDLGNSNRECDAGGLWREWQEDFFWGWL